MRLFNISSFEIVTDRFVEASQMLRAYASNPQQLRHLNTLRERGDLVGMGCKPFRFTGTTTATQSFVGHPLKPAGISGATVGTSSVLTSLDSATYEWPGTSTGSRGSNRFAQLGSLGLRDF